MRIAINGVGVAGPALAWWLKKYGFEPVLFERAKELRTGGYMIDFWGIGYDIAEKMGLIPQLRKNGYMMNSLRIVDDQGKIKTSISLDQMRSLIGDRFLSIKRGDLAATLYRACEGVETRFGTCIEAIVQHNDGVEVKLSDGSQEKFDLVIGADGVHSQVRAHVFGDQHFEHQLGAYVAAFTLSGYQPRNELIYFAHPMIQKQVSRVTLRDDQTLFLFTFRSELVKKLPQNAEEEKDLLKVIFKDAQWEVTSILSQMNEAKDFYFDRVSQIRMDQWYCDRVALLGDAAACVSLLAGEGTGLAITEAYVLAGELHRAQGDYKRAFANYQDKLQIFLKEKQKSAQKMISFFAPKNRFDVLLSTMVLRFSKMPLLSRFVIGPILRDKIELPDYI